MAEHTSPPGPAAAPTLPGRLREACASRLAWDSLVVLGLGGLGRAVALGKEVLVAFLFGVSGGLDAYLLALLVPSFLVNLLGASFSSALIPAVARLRAGGDEAGARALLASGLARLCGILLLAGLALALVPAWALRPLSPLAEPSRLAEIKALQLALAPVCLLGGAANVLAALINLRGDFKLPALAGVANTLLMAGLTAACAGSLGIPALVLGLDAGYALETVLLLLLLRRAWGSSTLSPLAGSARPQAPALRAALAEVWRNYGAMALSAGVLGLTAFVDNALASMAGEGSVAALGYAAKIPSVVTTLGGATLATVLLPHFSTSTHTQTPQEFWAGFKKLLRTLLLLVGPLALLGALFSRPLAELAFERGGFDARATGLVSGIQVFYLLQLPFYLAGVAASRVLQARSLHGLLLRLTLLALPLYAGLSYVLMTRLGAAGIALASLCLYAGTALCSIWFVRRACHAG